MLPLPIDPHLPALVAALRASPNLVLVAEPGAGKTTRLPRALLDAGVGADGEIVVLEPRRIAARMAARRVADELGESVGQRIGYQVRFEDKSSAKTRVRFVTEGVLARKLITDPLLSGVSTVLLDEFHERHLQGDVALALLRRLQRAHRPELRIVAMSATLDAGPLASFLGCEIVNVPGRRFEVAIEHDEKPDERALELRVVSAVKRLLRTGLDGDVLVFLPGAGEIRRAREALAPLAGEAKLRIALLHGDLPPDEQDRALAPSSERKLILSTNIAESSLTIEGVSAVIDSGLQRSAGSSPWSGLSTLTTEKISRASATQRAGRAGRVRAGRCIRLYTEHDFKTRPMHDKPEIARADLCETRLAIGAVSPEMELGAGDWLEAPPAEAWGAADALCRWLGAFDARGHISELGRRMLRFPLHPRLCRVLLETEARGTGMRGASLCALLAERDIALGQRARFDSGAPALRGGAPIDRARNVETGPSDALERLERFEQASAGRFANAELRALGLDSGAVRAVENTRQRLAQRLDRNARDNAVDDETPLLMAILAGFGDRLAKRRAPGSAELVLARGGSATRSEASAVRDADWVVVLDASERGARVVAHLLSAVEPDWLLELFPERVIDRTELRFDPTSERVQAVHALRYEALTLDESSNTNAQGPDAEAVLYEAARTRGAESFAEDRDALELFERRVAHAAALSDAIPPLPPDARDLALRTACVGKSGFAELRAQGLLGPLRGLLTPQQLARLEQLAPEHIALPGGRRLSVHYEPDRPPWVQSRLQDFFGAQQGPQLGGKPLVLHLLAPNQRAVQVTTDLAGFWQRHYPEIRRQLMRRYPRHDWPEDPANARPSPPRPRRA
jgi:ATP-dependent helicase HrpB